MELPESQIPRFHHWLFRSLCRHELYHELAGDLEEAFAENCEVHGLSKARAIYKREVFRMIRPSVVKNIYSLPKLNTIDMFRNYFKISIRNIWRDKEHSLISILGLAAGIVASVLIFQYVNFETSYDSIHDNSDGQVYRVSRISKDLSSGEVDSRSAHHYLGLARAMAEEVPEVKSATHLFQVNGVFTHDNVGHNANDVFFSTSGFFEVFDFKLLQGTKEDLDEPGSVFLSESLARRIFKEEEPMEKVIRYNDLNSGYTREVQVKGIYEDIPVNTHFHAPALMPSIAIQRHADQTWFPTLDFNVLSWRLAGFHTYIKAVPGISDTELEAKLKQFILKYREPYNAQQGREQSTMPHRIDEVHFVQDYENALSPAGNRQIINLFKIIGVLIVIIAWTNFINLTSAKAVKRAKEIGVRKSLGAFKKQLVQQFLLEALLINLFALFVVVGIVLLAIPKFHQLAGIPAFDYFWNFSNFWTIYLGTFILGAILSGLYPAIVLTRFEPIKVLRGNFKTSSQGVWLRKSLTFIQFTIVLVMLSGIISIRSQIRYMMDQDIGMNTEQTLVIDAPPPFLRDSTYGNRIETFQREIMNNPDIVGTSKSSLIPGRRNQSFQTIYRADRPSNESILLYMGFIDEDFQGFYGLDIIEGRGFDSDLAGDGNVALLNEEAVRQFDFEDPEDAIGKRLSYATGRQPLIVGVVKDFNNMGPKFAIDPLVLELDTAGFSPFINVRITSANMSRAVSYLESTYQSFFPGAPFTSFFLDQNFQEVYEADRRFNTVLEFFAIVAIFISCLGVFGLSSFLINQKLKEVSIRKVLGAGFGEIMKVLTKEYIRLILLSTLVAIPAAYYFINQWLNTFLVRIDLNVLTFLAPVAGLMTIVLVTIGNKTRRAALVNPAKTLKSE